MASPPRRRSLEAPGDVTDSLQAFAAMVAGSDGLSDARLVRLGAELARCADGEFREAAHKCQVGCDCLSRLVCAEGSNFNSGRGFGDSIDFPFSVNARALMELTTPARLVYITTGGDFSIPHTRPLLNVKSVEGVQGLRSFFSARLFPEWED